VFNTLKAVSLPRADRQCHALFADFIDRPVRDDTFSFRSSPPTDNRPDEKPRPPVGRRVVAGLLARGSLLTFAFPVSQWQL
jgi:hypothetical protein